MTKATLHQGPETSGNEPNCLGEQTEKILSTLAPREEMLLRMRFGIGQSPTTLEELSLQFLLPPKQLRRIELQALRKVRERTRAIYSQASLGAFSPADHSTSPNS